MARKDDETMGMYVYWPFYAAFIIYEIVFVLRTRRWTPQTLPQSVTQHDGTDRPKYATFFVAPDPDIGTVLSAYTTATPHPPPWYRMLARVSLAGLSGLFFGFIGVWWFAIENGWLQTLVVSVPALLSINERRHYIQVHTCTFVGTDGFQIATGSVSVAHRKAWSSDNDVFSFAETTAIYPLRSDSVHVVELRQAPVERECLHECKKPPLISDDQWASFVDRLFAAYLDYRWSGDLLRLAVIHGREQEIGVTYRGQLGIEFPILSSPEGTFFEDTSQRTLRPVTSGDILFTTKGLFYRFLNRSRENAASLEQNHDSPQLDERELPGEQIRSIHVDDDTLVIATAEGEIRHSTKLIPDVSLLLRLFDAGIWKRSVEDQIQNELELDTERLDGAGWSASDSRPYWQVIPAHRRCIWEAAKELELPTQHDDIAETIRSAHFVDGKEQQNPNHAAWATIRDEASIEFMRHYRPQGLPV